MSKIQRTNVVKPKNVIDMAMGYQDGVKKLDICTECLLAEINGRVDKDFFVIVLDEDGNAKAFVAWID